MHNEQARWFVMEVHPHETALRSYLRRSFPSACDVDDLVQESYLRIWRARALHPISSARSFLFRVARHLAIDEVRHRRASPLESTRDMASLPVSEDKADIIAAIGRREKIQLLAD